MIKEEEGSELVENNLENNFIKLNSYLGDSISITLNEDPSTYMGVKSEAEDQSTIINDSKIENNKKRKISKKKNKQKKQKKKEEFFSSDSESKSSELSPPKEKEKQKEKEKEKERDRNSFTELLEKEKNKEEEKREAENEKEEKNEKSDENLNEKKKIEEIDTEFEWEGSGKIVYVTGSFCDWKKFYIMTKNTKGVFSLTLSLPRGFHQYKFKVDNYWTYSKIHPKYEDNGNINNYIDTTDYNKSNENEIEIDLENNKIIKSNDKKEEEKSKENNKKKKENNKSQEKRKNKKHKKISSTILSVNFLNSQNYYTIYYPLRSEFNKKPIPLPGLYKTCFILNEDYKKKEERKFSEIEYVNNSSSDSSSITSSEKSLQSVQGKVLLLGEVIPYVKFQNLYHIHSNHLHSKLLYSYDNTVIDSMTTRYRYKFSTFIYYKPNEPVIPLKRIKHSKSFKIKSKK